MRLDEFLHDLDTVFVLNRIHVFPDCRAGQTQTVPLARENISVITERDVGYPFNAFLLNIRFDIIDVFAGTENPSKGLEKFDNAIFGKKLSLPGLGQV